jgi:hypothetical protein
MSSSSLSPAAFLIHLLAAALAGATLLLSATFLVDPLGQLPGGGGFCAEGIKDEESAKALVPATRRPLELFLGSSRVARGIAGDDARALAGPRVANLALNAGTLEEIDMMARNAMRLAPVKRIWIGLDFVMWFPDRRGARPLRRPRSGLSPEIAGLRYGLFDIAAVRATLSVAFDAELCRRPPLDRDGFSLRSSSVGRSPGEEARRFDWRGSLEGLRDSVRADGDRLETHYRAELARLSALVEAADARGVETIIFLAPLHPLNLRAIEEAGLGPLHRRWRDDVALAAAPGRLVDLTGPWPVSSACLRSSAPDCPFHDLTHYRPAVGRQILLHALDEIAEPASTGGRTHG